MLHLHDVSHVYAGGTRALDRVTLSMTLQTPAEGTIRLANAAYAPPPDYLAVSVLFRC